MDKLKLRYFIREAIENVANISSTFSIGDKVTTVDGDTATVTMAEHPFYTVELESTGTTKSFSFTELAPYEEKIIAKTSEAKDEDGIKYAIATNIAKYGRPFSKKGDKRVKLTKGLEKKREKHVLDLKKSMKEKKAPWHPDNDPITSVRKNLYGTVGGRDVVLHIYGSDKTKWEVEFLKTKKPERGFLPRVIVPYADVMSLLKLDKNQPKLNKESTDGPPISKMTRDDMIDFLMVKPEDVKDISDEELRDIVQDKNADLNEDEVTDVDKVAGKIQTALNKHGRDDAKKDQLLRARKALNKGNIEVAKKIVGRYLEEKKAKLTEKNQQLSEFVGGELEKRSNAYFEKLVPGSGSAGTVEGEMIRAINRILYRWYNDGDKFFTGYGIETAAPAMAFLTDHGGIPDAIRVNLNRLEDQAADNPRDEKEYERVLNHMLRVIIDYIDSREGKYTKSDVDMFDFPSSYEEDNDDDEDDDYNDYDEDEEDYLDEAIWDWSSDNLSPGEAPSKGYIEARKFIDRVRATTFRKLNDDELEDFRKTIANAFDMELREDWSKGRQAQLGLGPQSRIFTKGQNFNKPIDLSEDKAELEKIKRSLEKKFPHLRFVLQSDKHYDQITVRGSQQEMFDFGNALHGKKFGDYEVWHIDDDDQGEIVKIIRSDSIHRSEGRKKKNPSMGIVRKKLGKVPKAGKVAYKKKIKLPSGLVNYMDWSVSEKKTG